MKWINYISRTIFCNAAFSLKRVRERMNFLAPFLSLAMPRLPFVWSPQQTPAATDLSESSRRTVLP